MPSEGQVERKFLGHKKVIKKSDMTTKTCLSALKLFRRQVLIILENILAQFFSYEPCKTNCWTYQFPIAAVTNLVVISYLTNYRSEGCRGSRETKIEVSAGLHSFLEALGKNLFPCLLEAPCVPWLRTPFLPLQSQQEQTESSCPIPLPLLCCLLLPLLRTRMIRLDLPR